MYLYFLVCIDSAVSLGLKMSWLLCHIFIYEFSIFIFFLVTQLNYLSFPFVLNCKFHCIVFRKSNKMFLQFWILNVVFFFVDVKYVFEKNMY